jgi:hypothetical protein
MPTFPKLSVPIRFPDKNSVCLFIALFCAMWLTHLILLYIFILITCVKNTNYAAPYYHIFYSLLSFPFCSDVRKWRTGSLWCKGECEQPCRDLQWLSPSCMLQGYSRIVQLCNMNNGANAIEDSSGLAAYQSWQLSTGDLERRGKGEGKVLPWS